MLLASFIFPSKLFLPPPFLIFISLNLSIFQVGEKLCWRFMRFMQSQQNFSDFRKLRTSLFLHYVWTFYFLGKSYTAAFAEKLLFSEEKNTVGEGGKANGENTKIFFFKNNKRRRGRFFISRLTNCPRFIIYLFLLPSSGSLNCYKWQILISLIFPSLTRSGSFEFEVNREIFSANLYTFLFFSFPCW